MSAPIFNFDSRKTAQAVAFLLRLSGGKKSKGYLVKMLYGADKNQIRKTGVPLTGDTPYSMKNGPVLSRVLNLLNGEVQDPFWVSHISTAAQDNHLVHLKDNLPDDLLTPSEKESLTNAWKVFSEKKNWRAVTEFCHDKKVFPEWQDPGNSRVPITFEDLCKATGRGVEFGAEMRSLNAEDELLSQLIANAKASPS